MLRDDIPTAATQPRKRKWAPRSRAGCITCRIRRVRCDQAKPLCAKCTSTGRSCDWYPPAHHKESPIIPRQLDHHLPGTHEERSHFHFFASTILANLPPFFDFGFWGSEYLQACNAYPALFHASAAMAAVHRLMICQRQGGSSDSDQDVLSSFLLRQFNQSIKHVSLGIQTGRDENSAFILATCIVFTCLSAFQGRHLEAMGHVRSGLRILHSCRPLVNSGTASPIPWETFSILLTRLDTQAHCLQSPICEDDTVAALQFERDFLTDGLDRPLQSFLQVYGKIEFLCNSAMKLVRRDLSRGDTAVEDRSFYLRSFNLWKTKLSAYLADIRISVPVLAVISYEIRITFTDALLKYDPLKFELGWDDITDKFERVIGLATHMLENDEHASRLYSGPLGKSTKNTSAVTSRHSNPAPELSSAQPMTLTAGVSDILYFVALHCREPRIRRQAIHLLKAYPRREGICHTFMLGRVAEVVMEEESKCHCYQENRLEARLGEEERSAMICRSHRIRDVQIVAVDDGKRLAEVSLRTAERFESSRASSTVLVHW